MPYRDYAEDEFDQQWDAVVVRKDQKKITQVIVNNKKLDMISRDKLIKKREELQLSQLALNVKCKFPYKYTIRDIESGHSPVTLTELKTINTILELDIKLN